MELFLRLIKFCETLHLNASYGGFSPNSNTLGLKYAYICVQLLYITQSYDQMVVCLTCSKVLVHISNVKLLRP